MSQFGLGPASLGEALRVLRHRARATRDEIARDAGMSAGAISNYENDVSTPPATNLRRLAHVFADRCGADVTAVWDQLGDLLDQASQNETPTASSDAQLSVVPDTASDG